MSQMSARLSFRCSRGLVERVDSVRGREPREAFLRRVVEQALSDAEGSAITERSDSSPVSSSEGVRSAAPAEQPEQALVGLDHSQRMANVGDRDPAPAPAEVVERGSYAAYIRAGQARPRRDVKPFQRGGS